MQAQNILEFPQLSGQSTPETGLDGYFQLSKQCNPLRSQIIDLEEYQIIVP